ncbi:Nucleoporin [Penicillium argentinense]|uniref:Nucleoporin NUP188 n=1 Tax=Penicillium argentinense TaxID=1131581 RepID=A0A9W9EII0_9EURO|nr:Nucleoporin [Penicillium argentinense]KAJ5082461.1 Nucleoporin [Penicillium argentinense]
MAPIPEAYFPSLDKCFSGDAQLLSWKRAFLYTNDAEGHTDNGDNIAAFLSHPESIQQLSQSLNPFCRPSTKSKSEFESKTSAVHVETNSTNSFDLKEIKADAQWLSKTADIDEVTALRIVILERQDRPAARLTANFSSEEAASLASATGTDNLRVSVAGPNLANICSRAQTDQNSSSFDTEKDRRLRLRSVYISERAHVLKTFRKLLVLSLHDLAGDSVISGGRDGARKLALFKLGVTIFKEKSSGDGLKQFLEECITGIRTRLKDVTANDGWLGVSESSREVEDTWKTTLVEELVHILQIMFHQLHASGEVPSGAMLESWLELMAEYGFLESLQVPCENPVEVLLPLQSFVSLTTLAFLKVSLVVPSVLERTKPKVISPGQDAYFLSKDRIAKITEILLGACEMRVTAANPAAFSWGLVLLLLQNLASEDKNVRELEQLNSAVKSFQTDTLNAGPSRDSEQSLYEDLIDCARPPHMNEEDDPLLILTSEQVKDLAFSTIITLSSKAGSMSAIDDGLTYRWARLALLDLIRATILYMDYSPEIVESVLAILNGTRNASSLDSTYSLSPASDPKSVFSKDSLFMNNIFRTSRSRFPFETIPFLKLCRALVSPHSVNEDGLPEVVEELENTSTFTQLVPPNFQGYETIREDENANFVSLTQSLPMFESSRNRLPGNETGNALIVYGSSEIPSSTIGQVVSESRPAVIMWQHEYSCLSFLGSWLEEWSGSGGYSDGWDPECGAEIIGLLADLVTSSQDIRAHDSPGTSAKRILELASDGLSRQGDIISVVLDIFERNLQNVGSQGDPVKALEPIMACMQFVKGVLHVLPNRIWPFLSRSSFIGSDCKGGVLTAIISAVEIPAGEYPFLLSCLQLFEATVDDAASRAVLRKCPGSVTGKSTIASDWSAGIPSHVMRTIMLNFTRTMVEIFNVSGNWRFNFPEQQFTISSRLATVFDRILYLTYGINDSAKLESKVTGVFSGSAAYILDMLRPRSTTDLPFNAILRLISAGLETPATIHLRYLDLLVSQVTSTLNLSIKLVQAARLSGKPASLLEEQLFKATPVLTKLYALHDAYRLPVVSLLDTLVISSSSDADKEPPSLVGHLGAESACLFLDVLSQLDRSLNDKQLLLSIWHLLSTFVSKRQQWLAVFILTGKSPRQTLKKSDNAGGPKMRSTPFLQIALDKLAHIEAEDPQVALSLLEFVSHAQENWPWATPHLQKHTEFFNGILHYVSKLRISSMPVTEQIFATRIASVVTDICAVYLFPFKELLKGSPNADRETKERGKKFFTDLIPLVQWLSKDAVEVSAYNASLHANLKKNFEMRYAGCKLTDFKRSALETHTLGRDYYYDLAMGQSLLSYDFAWAGNRKQGFSEEFERANINLSLVEAQITLLNSWKFFAVEHCHDFMEAGAGQTFQVLVAEVAQKCLEANSRPVPPEAIFDRIQQVRVDFAQALTQCLVEKGSRGAEVFHLLEVVWKALRSRHTTYEAALIGDDTEYYRSLLNVLFLALQFHVDAPAGQNEPEVLRKVAKVSSDIPVVVDVVKVVVAQGFKSLTSYLHDEPDKCTPKDFAIIIAILQTCLQVKDADRLYEFITYHIQDNDTVRHATTLFSWADQLAIAGDPVYGEVSLSFLVKLSTLPMLAEHLAVEGVLMRLSTCRLTNFLQRPKGCGPFDSVPRLYTIWTSGFLPLCLNLLFSVNRAAPEVSAFLNQFEGQLNRAAETFSHGHKTPQSQWISLSMASEAYSLALISVALDRFRQAGPSAGLDPQAIQDLKWDKSHVKDDISELLSRRPYLRGRIVATNDKETEMSRQPPLHKKHEAENRLEEKIVIELEEVLACLNLGED